MTESGTYEELHASGLKYKVTYASPSINRTVWVNEKGSFATSKSNWPADAEWMVRRSLFDVTPDPRLNSEFRSLMWRDGAPNTNTRCIDSLPMGVPPEADRKWWASYCYSTGTPIIRMGAEDLQYYQAIFNQIVFFHGTYVARDVELLHVGKPYFHLHIDMLEPLIDAREETFSAPPQALAVPRRLVMDTDLRYVAEQNEAGIRRPTDHRTRMPQMLGQEVIVQVLVNKLGHVTDARGVNGDSIARFEGLAAAGKWSFAPYLVEGEPTEYYTELEFY